MNTYNFPWGRFEISKLYKNDAFEVKKDIRSRYFFGNGCFLVMSFFSNSERSITSEHGVCFSFSLLPIVTTFLVKKKHISIVGKTEGFLFSWSH